MFNLNKKLEKRSSKMFLLSTIYAAIAAGIYFFTDFKNFVLFIPAVGYTIKGYVSYYIERRRHNQL